jgi:hypothetical protein
MKKDYGTVTGKCPVCTINLWSKADNKPVIWPCGVLSCPHETPEEQALIEPFDLSAVGSSAWQSITDGG